MQQRSPKDNTKPAPSYYYNELSKYNTAIDDIDRY